MEDLTDAMFNVAPSMFWHEQHVINSRLQINHKQFLRHACRLCVEHDHIPVSIKKNIRSIGILQYGAQVGFRGFKQSFRNKPAGNVTEINDYATNLFVLKQISDRYIQPELAAIESPYLHYPVKRHVVGTE